MFVYKRPDVFFNQPDVCEKHQGGFLQTSLVIYQLADKKLYKNK